MASSDPARTPAMRVPARRREPRGGPREPAPGITAGNAEVRIIADEATLAAVQALLADRLGPLWQPGSRLPSRYGGGRFRQHGVLIVAVPAAPS